MRVRTQWLGPANPTPALVDLNARTAREAAPAQGLRHCLA
jgi:hypothetical protein